MHDHQLARLTRCLDDRGRLRRTVQKNGVTTTLPKHQIPPPAPATP
jgi:hypothetical protein